MPTPPVSVEGENREHSHQPATVRGNKPSSRLINHSMLIRSHFKVHQMSSPLSGDVSVL